MDSERLLEPTFDSAVASVRSISNRLEQEYAKPAAKTIQLYYAEHPLSAGFLAIFSFFSIVPVLTFVVFSALALISILVAALCALLFALAIFSIVLISTLLINVFISLLLFLLVCTNYLIFRLCYLLVSEGLGVGFFAWVTETQNLFHANNSKVPHSRESSSGSSGVLVGSGETKQE
ncbi:hypothetical protein C8J56DRAFT_436254 [Mycena floridula]|nr:hypothetical protein C8J56DRAFT_436254 [Mycena floridula]